MARSSSYGHNRERKYRDLLREDGWFVMRAPASVGVCDLLALKAGQTPRMIEVKGNAGSPYKTFGPADRAALIEAARLAGANPELVHWPPNGYPVSIQAAQWPE